MEEQNKKTDPEEVENKVSDLVNKVRRISMATGQIALASSILGAIDARKKDKTPPSKFISELKLNMESTINRLTKAIESIKQESDNKDNTEKTGDNI